MTRTDRDGDGPEAGTSSLLRGLPSVDRLAATLLEQINEGDLSSVEATALAREVLTERRRDLLAGRDAGVDLIARARTTHHGQMRRVLNGTGVILHTNLGRAPLADAAMKAVARASQGYVNVEFDLEDGKRGSRNAHIAAALCELPRRGRDSRQQWRRSRAPGSRGARRLTSLDRRLSWPTNRDRRRVRIPEVIAQSGAESIEVGTTNRTSLDDYQSAIDQGADAILRVHRSNFSMSGFVADVEIEALCRLGVPVINDLGSGALAEDLEPMAQEPSVRRSVRAGAALTCFSGDKLLGGPQAGILVGSRAAVEACRRHPLMRALRIGRLPLAALVATLALYRDPAGARREIPVPAMLALDQSTLMRRAKRLAQAIDGEILPGVARVGGGALPTFDLRGPVVAVNTDLDAMTLAEKLRRAYPPLLTRIAGEKVLIDPRTLADEEIDLAAAVLTCALSR